ncbi:MAG TPA: hypothetical protein VM056_07585 [Terriglobales bacterium]|nr:hypothetical protein [Terriglobales bacterium]
MTKTTESVAIVLEREKEPLIELWMKRVRELPQLMAIPLSREERMGHLPQLIADLITRLKNEKDDRPVTTNAHNHGQVRFEQGYSVPMMVDESRLLQVSIFETLRRFQSTLEADSMMAGVITIADECDAQLKDTVETFMKLEEEADPEEEKETFVA